MNRYQWDDKDPDEHLDYLADWSDTLDTGDAISAATFDVPDGLVMSNSTFNTTTSVVWLSGGVDGVTYDVVCTIVTSAGRTRQRTVRLRCRSK